MKSIYYNSETGAKSIFHLPGARFVFLLNGLIECFGVFSNANHS